MAGEFDFSGKVALITGAASGIGAATARWLDAHGIAELVLVDLDRPALSALGLSCKVTPFGGNVGDPALWNLLSREIGRLDHAVINAGVPGPGKAIVDLDIADWRGTMAVNLDGTFLGLRCAMRNMSRPGAGGTRGGSIVLTGSASGLRGTAPIDYGASKAAIAHMARIAGREGAPHGIRVNAIAPGGVDTPSGTGSTRSGRKANGLAAALRRWRRWRVPPSLSRSSPRLKRSQARLASSSPIWQH